MPLKPLTGRVVKITFNQIFSFLHLTRRNSGFGWPGLLNILSFATPSWAWRTFQPINDCPLGKKPWRFLGHFLLKLGGAIPRLLHHTYSTLPNLGQSLDPRQFAPLLAESGPSIIRGWSEGWCSLESNLHLFPKAERNSTIRSKVQWSVLFIN